MGRVSLLLLILLRVSVPPWYLLGLQPSEPCLMEGEVRFILQLAGFALESLTCVAPRRSRSQGTEWSPPCPCSAFGDESALWHLNLVCV